MTRRVVRWTLRGLGLALVVFVVATQVQWQDEVVLRADGAVLQGRVHGPVDGPFEVEQDDGTRRVVPAQDVARRSYGGRDVLSISYGFGTLSRRLGSKLSTVVLVLLALSVLVALTGWRWSLLLRAVDVRLATRRAVSLTFVGGFFNLAVPGATGGDVVKAWYAARETGTGTRAVLSVFVDRFVGLFGLVVFAGGVLLLTEARPGFEVARWIVMGVVSGVVFLAALVMHRGLRRAVGLSVLVKRLPFQGVLAELRASARLYRGQPRALVIALGISLFNHGVNATCAWALASALGLDDVTLGICFVLIPLVNLFSAVPLLPGGWGVGELAFAYFFGQVGVPPTEAVGLSVVFRLATLAVSLPGGVLWALMPSHPSAAKIRTDVAEVEQRIVAQADPGLGGDALPPSLGEP